MKQLHTYIFIISICISGIVLGQDEKQITKQDTLPPAEKYGLRLGIDLSKIIRTSLDDKYKALEFVGDFRFYKDYYLAAEIGNESLIRDEENINVTGSGRYAKIGIDYNSYNNWYGMQNSIFVGLRYGLSSFDQTLNDYRISTNNIYFPNEIIDDQIKSENLTANWIELIVGLKVELFYNIYLGANVSLKKLRKEKTPDLFDNLFIPGFGRTNDYSQIGVGYGYSISYLIPIVKKKK